MKGKRFKRATALLSTAAMLLTYADLSAIDFSVHAEENGDEAPELVSYDVNGDKTIDDGETAYRLDSADDLYWFADKVNNDNANYGSANAYLAADITVNDDLLTDLITVSEDGSAAVNDNKEVKEWIPIGGAGFTGASYNGSFDGAGHTISGLYTNSDKIFVGLLGLFYGTVRDVTVADSYFCGSNYVSAICGMLHDSASGCNNEGCVVVGNDAVGGIVGQNNSANDHNAVILNCHNSGTITSSSNGGSEIGGICGRNPSDCSILNCSNEGKVTGSNDIGGICGKNYGIANNCSNTAEISGGSNIGGIFGYISGYYLQEISDCHNSGVITGTGCIGGIAGYNISAFLKGCSNTADISGESAVGGICGYKMYGGVTDSFNTADITASDDYCGGICGNSCDISVNSSYNTGSINGGGDYVGGICGYTEDGQGGYNITDCHNYGDVTGSGDYVGGISGCNNGTLSQLFSDCRNIGKITGNNNIGGICGYICQGTYQNCLNEGTVNALVSYAGGICGYALGGEFRGCHNIGEVSAVDECAGGICGYGGGAMIRESYNEGKVTGSADYIGGVCGKAGGSTVMNSYNMGSVIGSGSYTGGLCGYFDAGNYPDYQKIARSYNAGSVSGAEYTGEICGDSTDDATIFSYYLADEETNDGGKTVEQFRNGEVCYDLNQTNDDMIFFLYTYSDEPEISFYQNIGSGEFPVLDKHHIVIKDGESYKNDAHNYENGICTYCGAFEDGIGARLAGTSLSLDGSIGVNFYMQLAEDVVKDETAYMLFTLPNGETSEIKVSDAERTELNGVEYYVFKCNVAATEMTDTITAQIKTSSGNGTEYSYSVKEYADYLLAHTDDNAEYANAEDLVRAMLNYGAYAQTFKEYKTDNLPCEIADVFNYEIREHSYSAFAGTKVKFAGANLSMLSNTTLRLFFKADDINGVTIMYGAEELEIGVNNGLYFVEIDNISPDKLSNDFTVTVSDGGMVTYSPMTYCYQVSQTSNDAALVNLVKAIAQYNDAAKAYFKEAKV